MSPSSDWRPSRRGGNDENLIASEVINQPLSFSAEQNPGPLAELDSMSFRRSQVAVLPGLFMLLNVCYMDTLLASFDGALKESFVTVMLDAEVLSVELRAITFDSVFVQLELHVILYCTVLTAS